MPTSNVFSAEEDAGTAAMRPQKSRPGEAGLVMRRRWIKGISGIL